MSAVDDLVACASACGFTADQDGVYQYMAEPVDPGSPDCNNSAVPHVREGVAITLGDALLRSGAPAEKARAAYEAAEKSPTFESWSYGSELRARIDGVDDLAARYADDDASNDPSSWLLSGHVCSGCHQKTN